MTRPGDPALHLDKELDITPEGEKRWVVEARAVVGAEWAATLLAATLARIVGVYGMTVTVRQVEGEGESSQL